MEAKMIKNLPTRNPLTDKEAEGKKRKGRKCRPRKHGPLRRQQVYATKEVICKANTLTFVEYVMERPVLEVIEVLGENDEKNQMETIQAVYKWKQAGNKIAVLNHAPVTSGHENSKEFQSRIHISSENR